MRRFVAVLAVISILFGNLFAETRLPVKRVVLYKNGVGYFEHTGRVSGNGEITIDFTSAQLNDVLKSLTVLDLGNGRISGVSYNSTAPLGERLKSLRLPVAEEVTYPQLLAALRGARIEVKSGSDVFTGRLLSVEEREQKTKDDVTIAAHIVTAVSDAGELRSFELTPSLSVRLLDRDLNEEVTRYLGLLSSTRDRDVRRMRIASSGNGERELFASYISEVPVWKSTYRMVIPNKPGEKTILQGWAIVDNTVGEDWNNVELALVAGAPQSFIQELSQPLYARRPVMQLPQYAALMPSTHEQTVVGAVSQTVEVMADSLSARPVSPAAAPMSAQERRELAKQRADVYGSGRANSFDMNEYVAKMAVDAVTREFGDLFEYKLGQPVTIHTNESAMVPILNAKVEAERVTLWNDQARRPLRALWVTNSSGLTLDAGTFNILEGDTFAGEGLMEVIKAGERRLLSYAVDQGVRVESKYDSRRELRRKVRIARGLLTRNIESVETRTYEVRNDNNDSRTVVIEHAVRPNYKLAENSAKPHESSANFHRFRAALKPHETVPVKVEEIQTVASTVALTNVSSGDIALILEARELGPKTEQALRTVLAKKNALADVEAQIAAARARVSEITDDQKRLRENMKALKGSAEEKALLARYTRELNTQEDDMARLRISLASLEKQRAAAQADLNRTVQDLTVEG